MINKQPININFSQGLDTKTDPKQVSLGKFLSLENSIFDEGGLFKKRNGYGQKTQLPDTTSRFVTTFSENLLAIGTNLEAYSSSTNTWINKGSVDPIGLSVLPLIRNGNNQSWSDAAIASNGLLCVVYTESVSGSNVYKYSILDSTTGQSIVNPSIITVSSGTVTGSPRVFCVGIYFVIVFTNLITATNHLQYISISIMNPTSVSSNVDISSQYTPATTLAFDGYVANNTLYLAWNGSDIGGAIRLCYLTSNLTLSSTVSFATRVATIMSVTADISGISPVIYASFYDSGSSTGYTLAVDQVLHTVLSPTQIISSGSVANITSVASSGICTVLYEINNNYGYDSSVASHYIKKLTISSSGTIVGPSILKRSVGLASKAFSAYSSSYFLSIYFSNFQPSYFLLDISGNIVAKLAYSNAGPYYTTGLPSVNVNSNTASIPYLIKDQVQSVNKTQGASNSAGIYSQLGINLVSFEIGVSSILSSEIGGNLNLSGGFLWAYDGVTPVDNNFFVWPDNVEGAGSLTGGALSSQKYFYSVTYEWSDNQGNVFKSAPSIPIEVDDSSLSPSAVVFTSVFSSGATSITVSSTTSLKVGQVITDATTPANIQAGTQITSIVGSVIGLSLPTAGNSAASPGDTLHTVTTISNTINIPTLRLTYKIDNPVQIVLYRWSTAQQEYFRVNPISSPLINNPSVDYVTYVDIYADSSIAGNALLYTTGGVLENISPPSASSMTLWGSRLFLVDAEDRNLLWYSKQVIENTPVEMSDLLTLYVAPTTSAQGSTGPMTALSVLDDKLIIFKKNALYYINGVGPDNTGANSQYSEPVFISSTVGCSNQRSIVFTPSGLMFQSDKGIWLLNRNLETSYIGAQVEEFNSSTVQSAVNIPGTNQVRFTLDTGQTLMYDYYYGQWGTFTGVPAISSTIYQGLHTYLDKYGAVFQETPGEYLDGSSPVLLKFTTSWINLAGLQGYERIYYFYLLGQFLSPHLLSVQVSYEYNSAPTQQTIIYPQNYTGIYGSDSVYGKTSPYGGPGFLEQWKIHTVRQKTQAFQITVTEIYNPIFGNTAGGGFTMSGIMALVGMKKGYRPVKAAASVG